MLEDRQFKQTASQFSDLASEFDIEIVEKHDFEASSPKIEPVPRILGSQIYQRLCELYPNGLYSHQSQAIEKIVSGDDVCLATSTASGKSLVFMAAAANLLFANPHAKVLALYPAKALIQDQMDKWNSMLKPIHLKIGFIDGSTPMDRRAGILEGNRIILMTPDVAHAWLMNNVTQQAIEKFFSQLQLLILDETHVYDGVFGTNIAFFLRRMQAVSKKIQIITSTATIGHPEEFIESLTGRRPIVFGSETDGSGNPPKRVCLAKIGQGDYFEKMANFLKKLSNENLGRFIAFADSRKIVEQMVATTMRNNTDEEVEDIESVILPYRAGYEAEDRLSIQNALTRGDLAGVVSTSALELGLDIGEINIVILLGTPPTVKSFWQRFGRAGRKTFGICILVDTLSTISSKPNGLQKYLSRQPEPSWLYLENRYIQYSNALCAAVEATASHYCKKPFLTLPKSFLKYLENEMNPTEVIPDDLYSLKQRAMSGPHFEFPIRSGIEKSFSVTFRRGPVVRRLGTLTYPQALREAYPGAVYYYMARPHRVSEFKYITGEIFVRPDRYYTTKPITQNMVFPKFQGGILKLLSSDFGFLAETELQVSEKVTGFSEQRGSTKIINEYNPQSSYARRPFTRFFETTGVSWFFPERFVLSENLGLILLEAFCSHCGVQNRDVGLGSFHANFSPIGAEKCQGLCIYDAAQGSLRLTQQFIDNFTEIIDLAIRIADSQDPDDLNLTKHLRSLKRYASKLRLASSIEGLGVVEEESDWVQIIAPGEIAICHLQSGDVENVTVTNYRYTPQGLMYELTHENKTAPSMVKASTVQGFNSATKMVKVNLMTGETKPV